MSSALEKALSLIELMVQRPTGASVSEIAELAQQPVSGVHRTLKQLEDLGYVRQIYQGKDYALTIKLSSMGLSYLGNLGINDVTQPLLDKLAQQTEELVRLAIVDGDNLVWVGVSQGTKSGLKYDPSSEQGQVAHLASSASGLAYLASMSDEAAMARVMQQGIERDGEGSEAPVTISTLLECLKETRERGYSRNRNSFLEGMAAMAVVIADPLSGEPFGTLSVAGPSVRMTEARMDEIESQLLQTAAELSEASRASNYFKSIGR